MQQFSPLTQQHSPKEYSTFLQNIGLKKQACFRCCKRISVALTDYLSFNDRGAVMYPLLCLTNRRIKGMPVENSSIRRIDKGRMDEIIKKEGRIKSQPTSGRTSSCRVSLSIASTNSGMCFRSNNRTCVSLQNIRFNISGTQYFL